MLPAPFSHRLSLADVLPSLFSSLRGEQNALALPAVDTALVLVVDGLGAHMLKARAGHARTLAAARSTHLASGFPTTTASALTTLTTGVHPGVHGMVGYTALHPESGQVINQLNGWGDTLDPASWQRARTQFEIAGDAGIHSVAVGAARYEDSGFTKAVLRGSDYRVAADVADRLEVARASLAAAGRGVAYVYVPELDQIAHRHGWESDRWIDALEAVDSAVRAFTGRMARGEGLLVTADHGMVDVPHHRHVFFDAIDGLLDGIVAVAGEPRCLQLHFDPDLTDAEREGIVQRWERSESARAWVVGRDQAIDAGWFGRTVDDDVRPRIGDLLVAARKGIAYYDSGSASESGRSMVGQHGSLTADETNVPLIRFGRFAA